MYRPDVVFTNSLIILGAAMSGMVAYGLLKEINEALKRDKESKQR